MADIKTELREISVATIAGVLLKRIEVPDSSFYIGKELIKLAKRTIDSDISSAEKIAAFDRFPPELCAIIDNAYKLATKIVNCNYFKISKESPIHWLGNLKKDDPSDISIGKYIFSLKEDSFILKNMGLYQLIGSLTNQYIPKGLNVFSEFAPQEYNDWFKYTWRSLISYLGHNPIWQYEGSNYTSKIILDGTRVVFTCLDQYAELPKNLESIADYTKLTSSNLREHVFAKWIKEQMNGDEQYNTIKKECSLSAGNKLCAYINSNCNQANILDFIQVLHEEYFYAKTTQSETTLLRIPNQTDFAHLIQFKGTYASVPNSQLNIISKFQNISNGKTFEFRNECRFSHGQFNGCPEAKMYIGRNTKLTDIFEELN